MSVFNGCKPRKEVFKGELDDVIYAADFGDLDSPLFEIARVLVRFNHLARLVFPTCRSVPRAPSDGRETLA